MIRHLADTCCLEGRGYQFWSGIGAGSPLLATAIIMLRKHNCHVRHCWRIQWHVDHHGHPVCKRHHSQGRGL